MLNEEFLTGLLGNGEVSVEEKIKQIISEHDADTRGLLQKRDELLGSEKKLKEQISAYEKGKGEYENKIANLEEMLEKASKGGESNKEYYETKLADMQKQYADELKKAQADRDYYLQEHLLSLRNKAVEDGIKDLSFMDGLKNGFIARFLSMNEFEPQEIDGQLKFLNKEHHTIEEAISAFALTQEGKAYLKNPSSGGGASGSRSTSSSSGIAYNPWKKESLNLTKQAEILNKNPAEAKKLMAEAGLVTQ